MYLITSDSHFMHDGILKFERADKFVDIKAHDDYILSLWEKWLTGLSEKDTFYFLGDLCSTGRENTVVYDMVEKVFAESPARKVMIRGNHDRKIPADVLCDVFDDVYDYPIYISDRVVLSHYPCAVYGSQLNVHGHTHGMKLYDKNHLCASIHVNRYKSVTSKDVASHLGKCDNWDTHFLYEPWAADYQVTQKRLDLVCDADNRIDLSASRLYHVLQKTN